MISRNAVAIVLSVPLWLCQVAAQDEAALFKDAQKRLNSFASQCFKAKYPLRAREIWLEVLNEYDTDDEVARKALGFLKVGATWAPDSRFKYPTKDEPSPSVARALNKKWGTICKALGKAHRELAEEFEAGGDDAKTEYHYSRALRFLPEDKKVAKASGRNSFEGVIGTDLEVVLLERSKRIERTVAKLIEQDVAVSPVDGAKQKWIERAQVPYIAVQSKNFTIWGDWSVGQLSECARHCERSLEFCSTLFEASPFKWLPKKRFNIAFFKDRDTWVKVLRANEDKFGPGRLNFVLSNASGAALGSGDDFVVCVGFEHEAVIYDMAVRQVAQSFCGFQSDALTEGIGHAVVGWFFGRNLIFSIAPPQEKEGTSTGADRSEQFNMPDLSVWAELAIDIAWSRTDTPSAKVPLIKASDFGNRDRIKSWSLCDYLVRRDPALLKHLDKSGQKKPSNQGTVAAEFLKASKGLALPQLDDDWRRFWTDETPALRLIRGGGETPLESISKEAPAALEAFNKLREELQKKPVGWSAELSSACKQHATYLKSAKAKGPKAEHTQDPDKGGSLVGRQFAERAIIDTQAKKIDKAVRAWLAMPGYRDALLDLALENVGIFVERGTLVMDVSRGRTGKPSIVRFPGGLRVGSPLPNNPSQSTTPFVVETEVSVKALGPEVEAAMKKAGVKGSKLGYPMTLHFYAPGNAPLPGKVECKLLESDKTRVEGFIHEADLGTIRRSSAPGLVVFYPSKPLKRGTPYTVEWTFENAQGEQTIEKSQFFTK